MPPSDIGLGQGLCLGYISGYLGERWVSFCGAGDSDSYTDKKKEVKNK